MNYKEIKGDLIKLAQAGEFDVIAHGCNCFCTMGAGIAPQMARAFDCDDFPKESTLYRGDMNKLGTIDFKSKHVVINAEIKIKGVPTIVPDFGGRFINIINAYTQFHYGGDRPLDYNALTLCLMKINHVFKGKHIGLPQIGCGLAGGDWDTVKSIIKSELKDCDVTVVIYQKD